MMVNSLTFTPFTVQQLFPTGGQPEKDDRKVKAAKITNLAFKNWQISNLTAAQHDANSHYARLSKEVKTYQVDQLLFSLYQTGIPDHALTEIASCYGYQFSKYTCAEGSFITLKPN